jgi:hydrogenase nickel incorporation protein HypA/HybF
MGATIKRLAQMHELPVTQSLLKLAVQHAEAAAAKRVTDIYLEIGQLSSYVDESVQFYWDLISKGTIAHGAKIHFHRIPMQLECRECKHCFQPNGVSFECPKCKSDRVEVISGEVFQLIGLDVEKEKSQKTEKAEVV